MDAVIKRVEIFFLGSPIPPKVVNFNDAPNDLVLLTKDAPHPHPVRLKKGEQQVGTER